VLAPIRWGAALVLGVWTVSLAPATESIWGALRAPGSVVVLRHSYAPGAFDRPDARLDDCSTQRNLGERGRAQATRIGEAFRRNGIEVGAVLSSPRCRCLDTGRLAFGRAQPWDPLQGALRDAERRQRRLAEIRNAMAAHRGELPRVLVTHGSVVADLTGLSIPWAPSSSCGGPAMATTPSRAKSTLIERPPTTRQLARKSQDRAPPSERGLGPRPGSSHSFPQR
jgi:broad specificity phosphatase PhoE